MMILSNFGMSRLHAVAAAAAVNHQAGNSRR